MLKVADKSSGYRNRIVVPPVKGRPAGDATPAKGSGKRSQAALALLLGSAAAAAGILVGGALPMLFLTLLFLLPALAPILFLVLLAFSPGAEPPDEGTR